MGKNVLSAALVYLIGAGFVCSGVTVAGDGGLGGGGALDASLSVGDGYQRALIAEAVAQYDQWAGPSWVLAGDPPPTKFSVYPMAGTLYGDLAFTNFVDLDPSVGILDFNCSDITYDGHDASDVDLRSFGEQAIGVPVFAAADGTVMATHDGEEDMHTECMGEANYVAIDHGAGRRCYYLHLKRNSVAVEVGESVRAGQQIGLVGSSGCSTGPHLHFATYDGTEVVEPFAGPCNEVDSQWTHQVALRDDFSIRDLNVTGVDIGTYPGLPYDMPRAGMFIQGTRPVRFWIMVNNLPADSTWQLAFRKPDGTIATQSSVTGFGNEFLRWGWYWWYWTLSMNQTGTWHILLSINDSLVAEAPFEVVSSGLELVNRVPHAVGVHIEPPLASEDHVLVCRADADLILDDPDYEIVRYTYAWTVDDEPVRTVTSAAHSDMLARQTAVDGQVVRCTVTPSDATANGPSASYEIVLGAHAKGDCDNSGYLSYADLAGLESCITGPRNATEPACSCLDFDEDGDVDLRDVGQFIASDSIWTGR